MAFVRQSQIPTFICERDMHSAQSIQATLGTRDIDDLAAALAKTDQPQATLACIDHVGALSIGHCLFSVNAFRIGSMQVERLYSSNPAAYPVGGRKNKKATAWGQQVLIERQLFIGEGEAAIRAAFDDHALMHSLGVLSIINVPVVWRGACLGVLNFACPLPRVDARQVATARLFGLIGFIVGPIVCGLFLTVWDIYGATFKDILPPVKSLHSGEVKAPEPTLEEKTHLPQAQKD